MGFRKGRQYAITWCKKAETYQHGWNADSMKALKCYDEAIPMLDYGYEEQEEINLAKADALSELGEGVSDETSMFKCYSSAIRFYTDKLFDDKHKPVVDIDDWEEGARKLQEICSRAINGFEKYYHYDEED